MPAKVMHYFQLKPRMQRMLMSNEYSELMKWHAVGRKSDGKLRLELMPRRGRHWMQSIQCFHMKREILD